MQKAKQISESLELGILLALAGGFMDAYSYICRGGVFANAQTGNILLIGVNLSEGNWETALRYVFPVIAFVIGVGIADIVRYQFNHRNSLHWRQVAILIEVLVLIVVSFMPQEMNLIANSLTSLACGIQVETFRKINGNGIATTMCIGNLRSATQSTIDYWHTKDKNELKKCVLYVCIIGFFVVGAIIGNAVVHLIQEKAIILCNGFLLLGFLLMFFKTKKE